MPKSDLFCIKVNNLIGQFNNFKQEINNFGRVIKGIYKIEPQNWLHSFI